jgi:hypothetical protein
MLPTSKQRESPAEGGLSVYLIVWAAGELSEALAELTERSEKKKRDSASEVGTTEGRE